MGSKIDKFSSDKLIGFLARLGVRFKPVVVKASKKMPLQIKCDVSVTRAA